MQSSAVLRLLQSTRCGIFQNVNLSFANIELGAYLTRRVWNRALGRKLKIAAAKSFEDLQ